MKSSLVTKKKYKKFTRHHSDRYDRLKKSWRKPKGIDSCVRRKFKGRTLMPNIGYGSNKKTRNLDQRGFFNIKINNVQELKILSMTNKKISAQISKNIGSLKKKKIMEFASKMDIKLSNPLISK